MPRKKQIILKDSDGDGLPDDLEKKLGTNPHSADTDGDGLSDYAEIFVYRTDPLNPDTDNDGMSDGDEVKVGRNPLGSGMLADFFAPGPQNGYTPFALHPKRLFFHALSAGIIKVFLLLFVFSAPLQAYLTPEVSFNEGREIIRLTNELRHNLGINVLIESPKLTQAAYNKAQDMLLLQYFSHTGPDGRTVRNWLNDADYNFQVAGENLAVGFTESDKVFEAWKLSKTHYANLIDPEFHEIGIGMTAGAYKSSDTIFLAQLFGAPQSTALTRGNKNSSPFPLINEKDTLIYIDSPQGKDVEIIYVAASLQPGITSAEIMIKGHKIALSPDENTPNRWQGSLIIEKDDSPKNNLTLPILTTTDSDGNIMQADLSWNNVSTQTASFYQQYRLFKESSARYVSDIFQISALYYKIILTMVIIALMFNILYNIHRRNMATIIHTMLFAIVVSLMLFI